MRGVSDEFLHKHECAVCPLNNQAGLRHSHMEPTGAARPLAYFLGEAPGAQEDLKGEQFVGKAGRILRRRIPDRLLSKIRFNNVVRCFPGGVKVTTPSTIKKFYRRRFSGPLTIITTKFGHKLPCTPHHPILTPNGWVYAYLLKKGDQVVNYGAWDEWMVGSYPNEQDEPITLDELFAARSFAADSERVVGTGLNFHGDRAAGEVDIIAPKGQLGREFDFPSFEFRGEQQLVSPDMYCTVLQRFGACFAGTCITKVESQARPLPESPLPFCGGRSGGPNLDLLRGCSDLYFMTLEKCCKCVSSNSYLASESLAALTGDVPLAEFIGGWRSPHGLGSVNISGLSVGSQADTFCPEDFGEPVSGGAELFAELSQAHTGLIQLDQVVGIDVQHYDGFLYNLETYDGWYIAHNHVVHNTRPPKNRDPARAEIEACRPSIWRDLEQSRPAAIVGFGNVPLAWATGQTGITRWCGRRVPAMIGGKPYWYFPILHPSAIQRDPKWRGAQVSPDRYGSEVEFQFALHVRRALEAIEAGLPDPVVHSPDDAVAGVEWVTGAGGAEDVERVRRFLRRAARRKVAGVDYETNCVRPYEAGAKILTAAVSTVSGTLAFPLDHREAKWTPRQRAEVDEIWREFLHAPGCRKVAHHLAFELEWSAYFYGKDCLRAGRWGDTMAQAYVLDERAEGGTKSKGGPLSLEFLCIQYFGINIKKLAGVNRKNLDMEPLPKVLRYNGVDGKYHRLLYAEQARALRDAGLARLYREHLERVPAAVLTQLRGIPINQTAVLRLGKKYTGRMAEAERQLRGMACVKKWERASGREFRPSANSDVMAVLNSMGHRPDSVDEEALAKIDHEFVQRELEWRKAAKIFGTYVLPVADLKTRAKLEIDLQDAEPPRVMPDGLIHPQTNVSRVKTSRTSADDPNYQNWPKRGAADAIEVRGVVEPLAPDEVIVSFDYGQIQARNVGMESLDRALLDAFWNDYDIHHDFMEHLARLHPRWVKEGVKQLARDKGLVKKYRNDVKHGFVFASFFGAGAKKTSTVLEIPVRVAEQLGEIFWDRFGGIKKWHGKLDRDYYKHGYVTGHSGYLRRAPVSYNERINAPIQADEAKIVLKAMQQLSKMKDLLCPNMEIHDDLTFIWPKKKVDVLAPVVIREMLEVPFEWAKVTPIVVEMSVGRTWAAQKEPGKFGHERFGAGVFSSHKYDGIDMPRSCPL